MSVPNHHSLPTWVQSALEQQLLRQTDVMSWLIEASAQDLPLEQFLSTKIAGHPQQIQLQKVILDQASSGQPLADSRANPNPTVAPPSTWQNDQDATCVGGRQNPPSSSTSSGASFDRSQPVSGSWVRDTDTDTHWRQRTRELQSGIERYQIRQEIGRGGCGVVSTAFDTQLQRLVVIKQIIAESTTSDSATRFLNEAQITGQLSHPGIVPVYEMGEDRDGLPFYVMKYLQGETLSEKIQNHRQTQTSKSVQTSLNHLLRRFLDVCQTLAYAHQSGIIHRDLKPANVMIGQFGETVVLDWGLARRVSESDVLTDHAQDQTATLGRNRNEAAGNRTPTPSPTQQNSHSHSLTQNGAVLGTAAYMSPEQARGANSSLDQRSDVFSLGVMLYEILSGVSPFRGDTLANTIENVARCSYRPLTQVSRKTPRALAAICSKAMAAEPGDRYDNANQLADDLESFLGNQPVSCYQERWYERMDRIADRHRSVVRSVFAAAVTIALLASIATGLVTKAHHAETIARQAADQAQKETAQALTLEKQASQFANRQLSYARLAADNWLIQLSGDLQFYPGLAPVRQDLIRQGLDHYQTLLQQAEQDMQHPWASWQWQADRGLEIARNLIRMGDLKNLAGQQSAANQDYQAADQKLQTLSASAPTTEAENNQGLQEEVLREMANAGLGLALTDANSDSALSKVKQIEAMLLKMLSEKPHSETRNSLARCYLIHGRLVSDSEPETAQALFQKGLADTDILVQQQANPRHYHLRETLLQDLAQSLYRGREWDAATRYFGELIQHLQDLPEAYQSRPDIQENISWAQMYLANCRVKQGRLREAIVLNEQSTAQLEKAWSFLYDASFYRENQAAIDFNLGRIQQRLGNYEKATEVYRSAIENLRTVIQQGDTSTDKITQMANLYLAMGQAMLPIDAEPAKQWLQQSEILIRHLSESERHQDVAEQLDWESHMIDAEWQLQQQLPFVVPVLPTTHSLTTLQRLRQQRLELESGKPLPPDSLYEFIEQHFLDNGDQLLAEPETAIFALRTLLELDIKSRASIPFSQQLVQTYSESEEAWFSKMLVSLANRDFESAQQAWEKVQWYRLQNLPHYHVAEEMLSHQLAPSGNWESDLEKLDVANPWKRVLLQLADAMDIAER